jgi:tRNA(Arg) A34 adenosine deaminase TadA
MNDLNFMQAALDEARQAAEAGEVPIGALVVR